ncbi:unnamed protein product, partial [Pylaiella littoralis]
DRLQQDRHTFGCTKQPRHGVAGTKTVEFCPGHAKDGMVDVRSKSCTYRDCTKQLSHSEVGTSTAKFCSGHAQGGMVNTRRKKCTHRRDCTKEPSCCVAVTNTGGGLLSTRLVRDV